MKKRHSEEQIVYALKRIESGTKGLAVCREMGIKRADIVQLEEEVQRDGYDRAEAAQRAGGGE